MSDPKDCKQQSKTSKRSASPEQGCSSPPGKTAKVQEDIQELALDSRAGRNGEAAPIEPLGERVHVHEEAGVATKTEELENKSIKTSLTPNSTESVNERPTISSAIAEPTACGSSGESEGPVEPAVAGAPGRGSVLLKGPGHASSHQQSDWAAIAAAEALASLTGGDGDGEITERPHSSKAENDEQGPGKRHTPRPGDCIDSHKPGHCQKTRAVAADSSTSVPEGGAVLGTAAIERIGRSLDTDDDEEDDDDSILGSSSSPDFSSGSEDCTAEDAECAIVSVKMAPETRQAVAQLARLQMQLETLERKGVRQHQRLELKLNQLRRPHLNQRSSIIKDIPGFWVTAVSSLRAKNPSPPLILNYLDILQLQL